MKILLTGSEGFVGRHFQKKFSSLGWDSLHEIHHVDIADPRYPTDARDFFAEHGNDYYDLVVHLAAVVGGREVIEKQPLKVAVDLSIDAEMFQWAMRTRPGRVVYFSSSAAYPIELQKLEHPHRLHEDDIDLDDIHSPDMTYGFAKLAGEYQAKFLEAEGVRTHVFRPFSGYGTDQDLCYPFTSYIERAKRRDSPFEIWGHGRVCRDFIHIDDVVDAVLTAIDQDVPGPVNLGTGRATSFNTLALEAADTAGYWPKLNHLLDKPIGVEYRVADPTKMLSFYTPKISLEEGIQRALDGVV
jgi:nucleoside-diphosphate-sugar epimerase